MLELLKEYLEIIKNVQDYEGEGGFPIYSLNQERIRLHRKIMDYLGLKNESEYLRLKDIFANIDKICEIYSECEEWKLKNENDIKRMAQYLEIFITSQECYWYLKGKSVPLLELPCMKR